MNDINEHKVAGRVYKSGGGILNNTNQINTAITLINMGARSAIIQHFTGMKDVKIRALCHEMGMPPTKGQAPTSPLWFAKPGHRAEAIIFYSITMRLLTHDKSSDVSIVPANIFISAYDRYTKHISGTNKLDINRAWQLLESIQSKLIQPVYCNGCHGVHLAVEGDVAAATNTCLWCELKQYRHCPGCGKKHEKTSTRIPTTLRICNECRNERRHKVTG